MSSLTGDTVAAPGFAGFVPSLKHEFGMTFGNATRKITAQNPVLRKKAQQAAAQSQAHAKPVKWREFDKKHRYATSDDRFDFPPVPGYTGYIPRAKEHFGKPYVETTVSALGDFQKLLLSKQTPPKRLAELSNSSKAIESDKRADFSYLNRAQPLTNDVSPYSLPAGDARKTFVSGYTGFVPKLQNHFGEPYNHSVRKAIEEFTGPKRGGSRDAPAAPKSAPQPGLRERVIPGYTGYVPGKKYSSPVVNGSGADLPAKDLVNTKPIPGYRGHVPHLIFKNERSFGINSKVCLETFAKERAALKQ